MKKLPALALALILAVSLVVPAAAASDDYWNGYSDGLMDGAAAGAADFAAGRPSAYSDEDTYDGGYDEGYHEGYISGYEGAKHDAELRADEAFGRGYDAGYADGCEDASQDGWYNDYPDEYYTSEAFRYGYDEGYYAGLEAAGASDIPRGESVVTAAGGREGEINVMLNGTCIDFGGVWPQNDNGRVLAPVRAILEALGAEVEYDLSTRTVSAALAGRLLLHQVGTRTVEVYPDGDLSQEPETVIMDCPSRITGGRTLVPVRFFSRALGFTVDWDETYRTVVLLDRDAISGQFDTNLTVVNLLLSDASARRAPEKICRQDSSLALDVTLFDTLNGDKTLGASGTVSTLLGDAGFDADIQLDLSDVIGLMEEGYGNSGGTEEEELLNLLKRLRAEIRYDAERQVFYVTSPLLAAAVGLAAGQEDVWVGVGLEDALGDAAQLVDCCGAAMTATDLAILMARNSIFSSPVDYYANAAASLEELTALLGDDCFTKSGNTYTLKADTLPELLGEALNDFFYWNLDGYYGEAWNTDLRFSVTDTGGGTCNYDARLYFRCQASELELTAARRGAAETARYVLHVRNLLEAVLRVDSSRRASGERLEVTPPEHAPDVLQLQELYA